MNPYRVVRRLLPKPLRRALVSRYARTEMLREALSNIANELRLSLMSARANRKFDELRGTSDLKIHLGCGSLIKPGWVNIDVTHDNVPPETNGTRFIAYDLRLGLPLDDLSVTHIYSSHFFEHLDYKYSLKLLKECHRVLRHGGLFRIALPDFRASFGAYIRSDAKHFDLLDLRGLLPEVEPGTETLVDHLNYGVYQHGEHKCIYDEEKIMLVLRHLGYSSVVQSSFNPEIDPDDPVRLRHSFYVEAVK